MGNANRGSLGSSYNYRGIALSNCICKIIDMVILAKYSSFLVTSDLQFAFKVKRKAKCTQQWPMRSRRAYTSFLRVKISHKLITCKTNFDRKKYYF